jgi:hypothetical protein
LRAILLWFLLKSEKSSLVIYWKNKLKTSLYNPPASYPSSSSKVNSSLSILNLEEFSYEKFEIMLSNRFFLSKETANVVSNKPCSLIL